MDEVAFLRFGGLAKRVVFPNIAKPLQDLIKVKVMEKTESKGRRCRAGTFRLSREQHQARLGSAEAEKAARKRTFQCLICGCVVSLSLMLGIAVGKCFAGNAVEEEPGSALVFLDSRLLQVGDIAEGDTLFASFRIRNDGVAPLLIEDAYQTCNCTDVDYPEEPIKKGEVRMVKISIDTSGKLGPQTVVVRLLTNGEPEYSVIRVDMNVI